jgi:hypothetical protein
MLSKLFGKSKKQKEAEEQARREVMAHFFNKGNSPHLQKLHLLCWCRPASCVRGMNASCRFRQSMRWNHELHALRFVAAAITLTIIQLSMAVLASYCLDSID